MSAVEPVRRRTVVAAGAVGAAIGALGPAIPGAAAAGRVPPSRARLEKLVGRTFTARAGGRRVRLRLDEVRDAPHRPPGLRRARLARWRSRAYVLVFSTRAVPEQDTWMLDHPRTGRFRLFLVPGQVRRGHRTVMTATFNGWRR